MGPRKDAEKKKEDVPILTHPLLSRSDGYLLPSVGIGVMPPLIGP